MFKHNSIKIYVIMFGMPARVTLSHGPCERQAWVQWSSCGQEMQEYSQNDARAIL